MSAVAFELPDHDEAHAPPEARGLARDEVRMLVARPGRLEHLRAGDLDLTAAVRGLAGRVGVTARPRGRAEHALAGADAGGR